jgi:hypothetical protein
MDDPRRYLADKPLWITLQKGFTYIFHLDIAQLLLFRLILADWKPFQVRLFTDQWYCLDLTPERIERYFAEDPVRQRQLMMFHSTGARGLLMTDGSRWIGYTWYVDLSLREPGSLGQPRMFTYVGLPKNFTPPLRSYWCFAGVVHPDFEGLGAFLYLINETYRQIKTEDPDALLYSNVETGNRASYMAKMRAGEELVGTYYCATLRLAGRYFSNIYKGKLKWGTTPELITTNSIKKQGGR